MKKVIFESKNMSFEIEILEPSEFFGKWYVDDFADLMYEIWGREYDEKIKKVENIFLDSLINSRELFEDEIISLCQEDKNPLIYVIKNENKVIGGMISNILNEKDVMLCSYTFIKDEFRGYGLFGRLAKEQEKFCKENGIKYMVCDCENTLSTYEKIKSIIKKWGYKKVAEISLGTGNSDVFIKDLNGNGIEYKKIYSILLGIRDIFFDEDDKDCFKILNIYSTS